MTHTKTSDGVAVEIGETHFTIRRAFGAPRERVFRAFSDSNELEKWYTEGDMDLQVHTLELRAGGTLAMSHLDGETRYRHEGTYVEVVENERLVYTMRWVDGPPAMESLVIVEFRDVDGKTEVQYSQEELPNEHVEHGARVVAALFENLEGVL